MGYQNTSFTDLYVEGTEQIENVHGLMVGEWADVGMYIGAGSSMPGWYTVIASVMLVAILVKGNNDEQDHYK
jgi:hypothetical protein